MRPELLDALESINEGMVLLRAKDARADQKQEKQSFIKELRDVKPRRTLSGCETVERVASTVAPKNRMHRSRIHKASSAEAILRHVLRQRGWTREYGKGELTGRQHLNLLDDVRQYSRMWMRHEAESFFDRYGADIDGLASDRSIAVVSGSGLSGLGSVERGIAARAQGALSRFFGRAKSFIREAIVAGAMALKGDDAFSAEEQAAIDFRTRKQHEYLDKFEREVVSNPPREIAEPSTVVIMVEPAPMTPGQFVARAESYGDAAWQSGQHVNRIRIMKENADLIAEPPGGLIEIVPIAEPPGGLGGVDLIALPPGDTGERYPVAGPPGGRGPIYNEERRVLGDAMHCLDCPPLAALGWQPIGTLPMIGDTECGGHCHCHFEYRVDANQKPTPVPVKPKPTPPEPTKPKKIKLKPAPKIGERYPLGGTFPPARPQPTLKELLEEAGSPYAPEEYEEA